MKTDKRNHTTKEFLNIMNTLERRFTSGNSVPIESTRITKQEFDVLASEIEHMIINLELQMLENYKLKNEEG